jgi:hypothetical protein
MGEELDIFRNITHFMQESAKIMPYKKSSCVLILSKKNCLII